MEEKERNRLKVELRLNYLLKLNCTRAGVL